MSTEYTSQLWKNGENLVLHSWSLFGDSYTVPLILVAYLSFVVYIGPKFMKSRVPYNLKILIILYNAMQVLYNFWAVQSSLFEPRFWKNIFQFNCAQMHPQERHDYDILLCFGFWHIMVNKLLDLLDTVFFVLCKKQNHVTFLHVQHHVMSVGIVWICGKYFPGHEFSVAFLCNTIVHTIMYFYYLVAALGPAFKKYLWWKKYLTIIQMVQFVIIGVYGLASLRLSCGYDHRIVYLILFNATLNFGLFLKFFLKTYNPKKQTIE
ncbi:elongation of very long chain fatty acids protein AAEL008004-like [Bradysia coprophila]|uniref:elongation of very long chain fatty acids protein AAEL008004-like n=1 Tax=Bradysia coprophila TaxID=38358 RepID=UPI00187D7E45|nr:elongation of very long chain fatty acids protein AAEL008004-like [Bradysia coprophila]